MGEVLIRLGRIGFLGGVVVVIVGIVVAVKAKANSEKRGGDDSGAG